MTRSEGGATRQRGAGTRARILAAAVDLFAEQGYDSTTVQQVVDRAGTTKGGLYHHFSSKDEILYELYHGVFATMLAQLEQILAQGSDPESALRAVIDSVVSSTAESLKVTAVFAQEVNRVDPQRFKQLQDDWRRYQDSVRELIRSAQQSGRFAATASPEVISWAIFGVTNSMPTWFRPDGPKSAADIAAELADLIINGLDPKEPA
jgi:AcrR family transcriptional regulator